MTWLIWRQYRTSAAISAALLAAFAALVIFTGLHLAAQFHAADRKSDALVIRAGYSPRAASETNDVSDTNKGV